MKITDKMIEDFLDIFNNNHIVYNKEIVKEKLKNLNYDVEEKKSALEEARELRKKTFTYCFGTENVNCTHRHDLANLYEKAIEELQQKPKIDDDLIKNIKEWIYANRKAESFSSGDIHEAINYFNKVLKQLGVNE